MKALLDENLPPALAVALNVLASAHDEDEVCHVNQICPRGTPDIKVFEAIAAAGFQVHITQDHHARKPAERQAIADQGLIVFVLSKAWNSQDFWSKSISLIRWWPAIKAHSMRMRPPAIFRVPWKLTGSGKFEQIRLQ